MWKMSQIEQEDLQVITADPAIDWKAFDGKTVVVSGSTGLIGYALTKALLYCCRAKVVALVRDVERAEKLFAAQLQAKCPLVLHQWSAEQPLKMDGPVDYIFHCASQTSSKGFVTIPVETVATSYLGTDHILQLARQKGSAKVVYLSTMEVYGTPQDDRKIDEGYVGIIDPINVRNCYPESKRLCENLCVSYASEYGVPACIARLSQTFGPGVFPNDSRVFAEFARCAIEGRDIILRTKGETKRSYLYTADAIRALVVMALRGESGHAYNVSNEATYCTIYEMAQMVSEKIAQNKIAVRIELAEDIGKFGYAPVLHMNLDTSKLCGLGWTPKYDLYQMFARMIAAFEV